MRCLRDARNRMDRFRYQLFLDAPETSPSFNGLQVWGTDGLDWRDPSVPDSLDPEGTCGIGLGVSARRADGKSVIWAVSIGWLDEALHVESSVELEDPEAEGSEELHWHREPAADLDEVVRLVGAAISEIVEKRHYVFD